MLNKYYIIIIFIGNCVPVQIPNSSSIRTAKCRALRNERLHTDPIIALFIMKRNTIHGNTICDIRYDHFFVHFWSNFQFQMYKEYYFKSKIPCMQFDATGRCCRKIKRLEQHQNSSLFLYEGILEVENKTFTALSMVSEQHDNLAISTLLDRWLRCGVSAPKMTVCDQSL